MHMFFQSNSNSNSNSNKCNSNSNILLSISTVIVIVIVIAILRSNSNSNILHYKVIDPGLHYIDKGGQQVHTDRFIFLLREVLHE
jgi:hypothetical protein